MLNLRELEVINGFRGEFLANVSLRKCPNVKPYIWFAERNFKNFLEVKWKLYESDSDKKWSNSMSWKESIEKCILDFKRTFMETFHAATWVCLNLLQFAWICCILIKFTAIYFNLLQLASICCNLLQFASICCKVLIWKFSVTKSKNVHEKFELLHATFRC